MVRRPVVLAALLALASPMALAEVREYDAQSVEWSTRRNEVVILDFHVRHCPLCNSGTPVLEQVIAKDTRAGRVQAFLVDFDNDEGLKHKYRVKYRETAIFLHRGRVVGRMAGTFRHDALARELREALNAAFAKADAK